MDIVIYKQNVKRLIWKTQTKDFLKEECDLYLNLTWLTFEVTFLPKFNV